MVYQKKFKNLSLISDKEKLEIKGGSYWTAALGFSLVSSTIMNFVELVYNLINATNTNQTGNDTSTSSSTTLKASTLTSGNNMSVRLSNYPSKTSVYYQL